MLYHNMQSPMDIPSVDRIIALLDMDCFYVQVEQREQPDTWGRPCAVVQYTGGGVIAVNYEARKFGIQRGFTVPRCITACRDVKLFRVTETNGKGDLTKYRNASEEVFKIIADFDPSIVLEKASIDEFYLDLTSLCIGNVDHYEDEDISDVKLPCETLDHQDMKRLIIGAKIVRRIRREIKEKTQFSCSAGVSFNKMLAKLACSIQKPNGQSVIMPSCVPELYSKTNISSVRGLGGKLGADIMSRFQLKLMSELAAVSEIDLKKAFGGKTGKWIYALSKGIDDECVVPRSINKSLGCGKNFRGLKSKTEVMHWIDNLAEELVRRLEIDIKEHNRRAKIVSVNIGRAKQPTFSRAVSLREYNKLTLKEDIDKQVVSKLPINQDGSLSHQIKSMSLVASRFVDFDAESAVNKTPSIRSFCQELSRSEDSSSLPITNSVLRSSSSKPSFTPATSSSEILYLSGLSREKGKGFFYRKTCEFLQSRAEKRKHDQIETIELK